LLRSYLHRQQTICAAINLLLNPALGYLMNRGMRPVAPLDAATDAAVTCLVMGLLIGVLVAPDARRFIRAARLASGKRGALDRLPAAGWALGLVIGVCGAAIIAPLAYGLPWLAQLEATPFALFIVTKALWTAAFGALVTRLVVLRQLALA
jgi:membrane-bound metal-dependent hydrolase YbcI (DUF457 family)